MSIGLDVEELAALKDLEEVDLDLLGVPDSSLGMASIFSMVRLTVVLPLIRGLGALCFSLGSEVGGGGSTLESVYSKTELS